MNYPELTSKVLYKGLTSNVSSCTCEEFLAPKLNRYILRDHSETCKNCKCSVDFEDDCKDGHPTFYANFHTAASTVTGLTLGLTLLNGLIYCCFLGRRSQRKIGYQRIVDPEIIEDAPLSSGDSELSKRVEKLFKENKSLKLKFKALEEKVSNNQIS
ncbi:hypothetical protein HNY73_000893 [Argiope bruennichi]|uniref:Uncharacterized protein n=1 Tax=Argiope bruennichi TaxID=94029 RepID=A0A8T0G261_ARGBR|nr:hypothetical protein HNY73_000893 [Argiope bruennichi]